MALLSATPPRELIRHEMADSESTVRTVGGQVARPPHLADPVVFVDGMPGCGKTLFSALVSAFDRVEVEKYNYALEYACGLHHLGRMTDDAAATMVRLLTDVDLYHLMISRETNFRWSDLSSIFRHAHPWRYLRRLLLPDGPAAIARITQERPILNLVTHNLLPICAPVVQGLGGRFRIVEIVRHPLYMLKQWFLYIDRYGTDVRDFTIWVSVEDQAVPWFAAGWETRYLRATSMDRVIYAIEQLGRLGQSALARMPESHQRQVLTIPFEPFVLDPWPTMRRLAELLGAEITRVTRQEMRRQRVPRSRIAQGLDLRVYRDNGWRPAQGTDEREEWRSRWQFAEERATPEGLAVLDRLCAEYEATHLAGAGLAVAWR